MTLSELLQQSHFASPAQEAVLNVLATQSWITGEIAAALGPHGVTPAQYNVLRILRGRHPEPATCAAIGCRLVDRTPDVTRLLDRLERDGLVTRCRAARDRRVVEVGITARGMDLLARLDGPVETAIARMTRHLCGDDLAALTRLLETLRTDQQDGGKRSGAETGCPSRTSADDLD